ncbi:MAG: preprotein translocase subunit SecE [bacterium]|nr:preprotein translocase subunit SecE [bacterium]
MLEKFITFLKEARIEIKKVIWPTRQNTIQYTIAVILISLGIAGFLGGLDFIFTYILNKFVL